MELKYEYKLLKLPDDYDRYGICIESVTERLEIPHITYDHDEALRLLERLERGQVTPVTLQDIIDDYLAE